MSMHAVSKHLGIRWETVSRRFQWIWLNLTNPLEGNYLPYSTPGAILRQLKSFYAMIESLIFPPPEGNGHFLEW